MVKKQAILFDLDGTLWDSTENVAKSWIERLEQLNTGLDFSQEKSMSLMGLPMDEYGRRAFPQLEDMEREALMEELMRYENDYVREHGGNLYPGLRETLEKLKPDYFLAIVSNCQDGYIEAFLDHYQLWDFFDDRESYGRTGLYKAENIRLVMERNGLEQGLYIGDIDGDRLASEKAGLPFVFAAYGFGEVDAPWSVQQLSELPEVAQAVFESAR